MLHNHANMFWIKLQGFQVASMAFILPLLLLGSSPSSSPLLPTASAFHVFLPTTSPSSQAFCSSTCYGMNHIGKGRIGQGRGRGRGQMFMTISDPTEDTDNPAIEDIETTDVHVPSFIQSPVLKDLYPAMMEHLKQYGNPNIPLGTTDGKRCKTLRRLVFQNRLSEEEVEFLSSIKFRFNDFEGVYAEADFDECLQRLLDYEAEHKTGYQIPKKYKPDPELGAWVTMIRRIGKDSIDADRRAKLDDVGFAWVSTRKCGSAFMKNFRPLKERLEKCAVLKDDGKTWEVVNEQGVKDILAEQDVIRWVRAQRDAAAKGNLSEARCDYLDRLPGLNWREI